MMTERQALQRTVAVAAIVPIAAGLYGVVFGMNGLEAGLPDISADSHFRYLSGLLLGIGLLFWWTVPAIEERGTLFRFLTLVVVLGGLARLSGLFLTGIPSLAMLGGLGMELAVTPLLCLWQVRVANRAAEETGIADIGAGR